MFFIPINGEKEYVLLLDSRCCLLDMRLLSRSPVIELTDVFSNERRTRRAWILFSCLCLSRHSLNVIIRLSYNIMIIRGYSCSVIIPNNMSTFYIKSFCLFNLSILFNFLISFLLVSCAMASLPNTTHSKSLNINGFLSWSNFPGRENVVQKTLHPIILSKESITVNRILQRSLCHASWQAFHDKFLPSDILMVSRIRIPR